MTLTEMINRVAVLQGKKDILEEQKRKAHKIIATKQIDLEVAEKAAIILKEVGLATQQQLQYHIGDITSLALQGVFENPYELKVNFVEKRNQTECDLIFSRDNKDIEPLESSGYGAVDVASFALRVASWSMQHPRSRNTIILDEPFKFLSKEKQIKASTILNTISNKLGIQFIIVTHESTLTEHANKVFTVVQKDKISMVTSVENNSMKLAEVD